MTKEKNLYKMLMSFLLISLGMMLTITFGFVPLLNYFEVYGNILYTLFYWFAFGFSCIISGMLKLVDRIKKKENGRIYTQMRLVA